VAREETIPALPVEPVTLTLAPMLGQWVVLAVGVGMMAPAEPAALRLAATAPLNIPAETVPLVAAATAVLAVVAAEPVINPTVGMPRLGLAGPAGLTSEEMVVMGFVVWVMRETAVAGLLSAVAGAERVDQ